MLDKRKIKNKFRIVENRAKRFIEYYHKLTYLRKMIYTNARRVIQVS